MIDGVQGGTEEGREGWRGGGGGGGGEVRKRRSREGEEELPAVVAERQS